MSEVSLNWVIVTPVLDLFPLPPSKSEWFKGASADVQPRKSTVPGLNVAPSLYFILKSVTLTNIFPPLLSYSQFSLIQLKLAQISTELVEALTIKLEEDTFFACIKRKYI